jgi:hypothetical protein
MKQISTGAGLLGLGLCMVATAVIATRRGGEAYAQVSVAPKTVVSAGVHCNQSSQDIWVYRVWSDGGCDYRWLGKNSELNLVRDSYQKFP